MASLTFWGAAGTVTGSKTLVETDNHRFLLDCGLFQGIKELRSQNWQDLPVEAAEIEAVVLTHGHLDHVGFLPRLYKMGFRGQVHCTAPTRDIASIILKDSAKIQEEDAEEANRKQYSRHQPAEPLYTLKEAEGVISLFQVHEDGEWHRLHEECNFRFTRNGHILGSVAVELDCQGTRIVFSGDLGRRESVWLEGPRAVRRADILVLESTYGDRLHPEKTPISELAEIVNHTYEKNGSLIIPSFAVERAQDLMFLLAGLIEDQKIPDIPIYLDSPMGLDVTLVMEQYPEWHKLHREDVDMIRRHVHFVRAPEETAQIIAQKRPKIIVAGSGMVTGGRVLSYLQSYLGDPRHTVLLVGYQAVGTRGWSLLEGCHELKFFGEYYPVKAEIRQISTLSAHGDQEDLLNWLGKFEHAPWKVFLNHGEVPASNALKLKIEDELGWAVEVARYDWEYQV
jgi:metallo-beta-lactamase family protein